jgi:hypothetical protein
MTRDSFTLRARLARRMADPNFNKSSGLDHHLLMVNVSDLPRDLPMEANARRPNTNKQVYREVKRSLLNENGEPGSFHLKNKGIVIIAEEVSQKAGTNDQYIITLDRTSQGILDGGHTYQIIMECQDAGLLPEDQYVFVQVRTGVPKAWVPDISRGLNTALQVQDMSLDHLKGLFEWLKETLRPQSYYPIIAWSENDEGRYDARDIIAIMYLMNIDLFPGSSQHPIAGYEKKSEALKAFEQHPAFFRNARNVLPQMLYLHDLIAMTAAEAYNRGASEAGARGRGRGFKFVKVPTRSVDFPFIGPDATSDNVLEDAALYPILAAFRVFLKKKAYNGEYEWVGSFEEVKTAWNRLAYELMKITHETSDDVGRSNNAIGKSRTHWNLIYQRVENYKLRQAAGVPEPQI